MLHWQVSRQKFSLVVLPVAHMDTQRQSRTLVMTLIQRSNPSLNFPFNLKKRISKVGPDYSFAIKQLSSSYQAPGTRLDRKLRKRLRKLGALSLYSSSKQEPESSWMISMQCSLDIHLQQHNQASVGFFTSLPIEQIMSLSTIWSHSTLPSRVLIGQRFHSLYSWQRQSPSFECFKGNLKDTRSKQESPGSRICVNSVSCVLTRRYFGT